MSGGVISAPKGILIIILTFGMGLIEFIRSTIARTLAASLASRITVMECFWTAQVFVLIWCYREQYFKIFHTRLKKFIVRSQSVGNHRLEARQHALKYPQVGKALKIVVERIRRCAGTCIAEHCNGLVCWNISGFKMLCVNKNKTLISCANEWLLTVSLILAPPPYFVRLFYVLMVSNEKYIQ